MALNIATRMRADSSFRCGIAIFLSLSLSLPSLSFSSLQPLFFFIIINAASFSARPYVTLDFLIPFASSARTAGSTCLPQFSLGRGLMEAQRIIETFVRIILLFLGAKVQASRACFSIVQSSEQAVISVSRHTFDFKEYFLVTRICKIVHLRRSKGHRSKEDNESINNTGERSRIR